VRKEFVSIRQVASPPRNPSHYSKLPLEIELSQQRILRMIVRSLSVNFCWTVAFLVQPASLP